MLLALRLTLGRAWRLATLAAAGPGAWRGYLIYALVLALNFVGVWISVRLIDWNRAFYDALEQLDGTEAFRQIGIYVVLVSLSAASWLIADWFRKLLWYMWRGRLTDRLMNLWLKKRAYWIMRPGYGQVPVDNPDQRVAEDCRLFVERLLQFTLDLISESAALISYLAILWSLSGFVLNLTIFGTELHIPHYMFWLAPVIVIAATVITHLLGRPLKHRYFEREKVEADFRHRLIQLRDRADLVAQSGGEQAERRGMDQRFAAILRNWRQVMRAELKLGMFQRPYYSTVIHLPTFFALPMYFAGAVTLGGLMQLASAFSNVTTTLSWFIFQYRRLAEFVAVCERLDGLTKAAGSPAPLPGAPQEISRRQAVDGGLRLAALRLATPDGRWLEALPDLQIEAGQTVLITGASGQGKTTLLSAFAGIWPWGQGRIEHPGGMSVFLPAGAPVMGEDLISAACHPSDPATIGERRITEVLSRLGLGHRLARPSGASLAGLSMGERQRLGLARAVLNDPEWLLMDEATAALDANAEAALLSWLRSELPNAMILMVAHRIPVGLAPDLRFEIGPQVEKNISA